MISFLLRVPAVAITSSQSRPPQYLDLKFTHELFFFNLKRELYSNKGIRWAVSQQAADQEARGFIHPTLGHTQCTSSLRTHVCRVVGCPHYMLNNKTIKR
jgi:hypothetical protein